MKKLKVVCDGVALFLSITLILAAVSTVMDPDKHYDLSCISPAMLAVMVIVTVACLLASEYQQPHPKQNPRRHSHQKNKYKKTRPIIRPVHVPRRAL